MTIGNEGGEAVNASRLHHDDQGREEGRDEGAKLRRVIEYGKRQASRRHATPLASARLFVVPFSIVLPPGTYRGEHRAYPRLACSHIQLAPSQWRIRIACQTARTASGACPLPPRPGSAEQGARRGERMSPASPAASWGMGGGGVAGSMSSERGAKASERTWKERR